MLVGVLALSAAEPLAMRKLRVLVLLVSRSLLLLLGVWVLALALPRSHPFPSKRLRRSVAIGRPPPALAAPVRLLVLVVLLVSQGGLLVLVLVVQGLVSRQLLVSRSPLSLVLLLASLASGLVSVRLPAWLALVLLVLVLS
jgi:hypothetical protein